MMLDPKNVNQLLLMPPMELLKYLDATFIKPLPMPTSSSEFAKHNHLLGELANTYAFLTGVHAAATIVYKDNKRKKKPKEELDEDMLRRDVLAECLNAVKMQYTAFSRMITVQKQADDEMRMLSED